MKVAIFEKTGGPEVFQFVERPDPLPAAGEVIIDIYAAALNFADLLQRRGTYGLVSGSEVILGLEVSGTISALGQGVSDWKIGDQVCALLSGGGYAERVAVPASQVMRCPAGVSLLDAAAIPEAACTVWSNVLDIGRLSRGETFLVHGGAGGIGTLAIQLAREWGARVLCTAGAQAKREFCRELGAEIVIDYRAEPFEDVVHRVTDGKGVDLVLDNMGAEYLDRNIQSLAPDGRIVIIGLQSGREAPIHLGKMMGKRASLHTTSLRDRSVETKRRIVAGVRKDVWPHFESGQVKPVTDKVFRFEDVVMAHRYMEEGKHIGKIIMCMSEL